MTRLDVDPRFVFVDTKVNRCDLWRTALGVPWPRWLKLLIYSQVLFNPFLIDPDTTSIHLFCYPAPPILAPSDPSYPRFFSPPRLALILRAWLDLGCARWSLDCSVPRLCRSAVMVRGGGYGGLPVGSDRPEGGRESSSTKGEAPREPSYGETLPTKGRLDS